MENCFIMCSERLLSVKMLKLNSTQLGSTYQISQAVKYGKIKNARETKSNMSMN